MPDKNYTHIIGIIDRSGSMMSIKDDAIGGFNQLLEDQQKESGRCTMTLVQFDDQYEEICSFLDVDEVEPRNEQNYVPRGQTRLLDAIGKTVVSEGEKLTAMDESDRPGLVCVVVLTDGKENDSQEYTSTDQIKEMLVHQQEAYRWKVTYLGANQDAFAEARKMGIHKGMAANFAATGRGVMRAYKGTSNLVSRARNATAQGDQDGLDGLSYSADERKDMSDSSGDRA